jgi:hypothetical protein
MKCPKCLDCVKISHVCNLARYEHKPGTVAVVVVVMVAGHVVRWQTWCPR